MEQGMFTTGRIIFVLSFFAIFFIVLIISYRKDMAELRLSYKNWWIVLLAVILFLGLFLFLKRKFIGV